jgi:hypothetical protein
MGGDENDVSDNASAVPAAAGASQRGGRGRGRGRGRARGRVRGMSRASSANMTWVNPSKVTAAGELSPGAASDDAKREVAGKPDETASAESGADSSKA